jgi:hypothetical protein
MTDDVARMTPPRVGGAIVLARHSRDQSVRACWRRRSPRHRTALRAAAELTWRSASYRRT